VPIGGGGARRPGALGDETRRWRVARKTKKETEAEEKFGEPAWMEVFYLIQIILRDRA
jgi:hypothetical protein